MSCKAVVERLEKVVSLYYNKFYNVAYRMSSKHESYTTHPKSIQSINKQSKETSIEFRINGRKTLFPITSMLDTAKDETLLEGAKKVFYNNQKHACVCRPSEEMGGRTTGHFGTSFTGTTHNRLRFPTRRRN